MVRVLLPFFPSLLLNIRLGGSDRFPGRPKDSRKLSSPSIFHFQCSLTPFNPWKADYI